MLLYPLIAMLNVLTTSQDPFAWLIIWEQNLPPHTTDLACLSFLSSHATRIVLRVQCKENEFE